MAESGRTLDSDHDPAGDLPPQVVLVLEKFLLCADDLVALDRIWALSWFLETWSLSEQKDPGWLNSLLGRDYYVAVDEAGALQPFDPVKPTERHLTIPADVLEVLALHQTAAEKGELELRRLSLQRLLGEWESLLTDDEKLLGHLLLKHKTSGEVGLSSQDDLIMLHSRLHCR